MRKIIYLANFFLCLFSGSSLAAKAELYQVRLLIPKQVSIVENDPIFQEGFQVMLARITGNPKITRLDAVKNAQAKNYLQQYKTEFTSEGRWLVMSFNEQAVDGFLKNIEQPIWFADRPTVLMWVVLDNKTLLSSTAQGEVGQAIKVMMDEYGLPVNFPIYDLQDINKAALPDVSANNIEAIKRASERYRSDVLVVGRLNSGAEGFNAQWSLYIPNTSPIEWKVESKDRLDLLKQSTLQLLSKLSENFSQPVIADSLQLTIDVINVKDLQVYTEVLKHLKNISSVASIETQKIQPNECRFIVELAASKERFLKSVESDPHLLLKTDEAQRIVLQWQN